MKVNKSYPFAFVYFFVNAVGLPFGLLYTTILTPLFYMWIVIKGKRIVIFKFLVFLTPFLINHIVNGVDSYVYAKSVLLFFTVYIFCYAFYTLITISDVLGKILEKLLISNFILTLIALVCLVMPYKYLFWGNWSYSTGGVSINALPRLTLFTYEPSYYATLIVPIFGFYFSNFVLARNRATFKMLLMIALPLVLSLSMGVISGLAISISILFLLNVSRVFTSKKLMFSFSASVVVCFITLVLLLVFYRDNPIFLRAAAFLAGDDQSGRGRTTEAFNLSYLIAKEKSIWWGVGPGQLKIIGDPIINDFYHYLPTQGQVSIPNAFAETLALFGIAGVSVRFLLEVWLFYKTKVLNNYYRTLLFFYIFVYQFTGSFTTNIAEYVIWILAFTNIFPQFDKKPIIDEFQVELARRGLK